MHGAVESLRQETGAALFQDLELISNPWPFNVRRLQPDIARATHIWQVGDMALHACMTLTLHLLATAASGMTWQCPWCPLDAGKGGGETKLSWVRGWAGDGRQADAGGGGTRAGGRHPRQPPAHRGEWRALCVSAGTPP